jgi:hypothetical protein
MTAPAPSAEPFEIDPSGVFVSWNGQTVEIRLDCPNTTAIATLEPQALVALDQWRRRIGPPLAPQ